VGGSRQPVDNDTPDRSICKHIVDFAKNVFEDRDIVAAELPEWAIGNR
jgi:hypothetical protein